MHSVAVYCDNEKDSVVLRNFEHLQYSLFIKMSHVEITNMTDTMLSDVPISEESFDSIEHTMFVAKRVLADMTVMKPQKIFSDVEKYRDRIAEINDIQDFMHGEFQHPACHLKFRSLTQFIAKKNLLFLFQNVANVIHAQNVLLLMITMILADLLATILTAFSENILKIVKQCLG